MATTVQDIQNRLASSLDNTSSISSGSADWNIRMVMLNRAEIEWAEMYDWKVLYREYNFLATSSPTLSMPSDFRKLAGTPRITYDLSTTEDFEEVNVEDKSKYREGDSWFYVMGSPQVGISLISARAISSGASVFVPYYAKGATLATTTDVSHCPNPEFLVERTRSLWLEAREDPRADEAKNTAEFIKTQMLDRELTHSPAHRGAILNETRSRFNFRVGRD